MFVPGNQIRLTRARGAPVALPSGNGVTPVVPARQ
jgi:hypothetical protein